MGRWAWALLALALVAVPTAVQVGGNTYSKLSFHISGYPEGTFEYLERARPRVVKVFQNPSEMNIEELRRRLPGVLIVYRMYTPANYDSITPDAFVAQLEQECGKLFGRGIVWEGINEPVITTVQQAQALNAWYVRFAELLHARGERTAAFSFSTGHPATALLAYLQPAIEANDYIALHEYNIHFGYYRQLWEAFPAKKPVLLTEIGHDIAGSQSDGWQGHLQAWEYLELLKRYDRMLLETPYVLGATIYQYGDPDDWFSFDVRPIMSALVDYIAWAGGGAPLDYVPAPNPSPTPADAGWCPFCTRRVIAKNFWPGRNGQVVKAIVLHVAAGEGSLYDDFSGTAEKSAHFWVSRAGAIEQYVNVQDSAWANGLRYVDGQWQNARGAVVQPTWSGLTPPINPNWQTVSVEFEGTPTDTWTPAMQVAAYKLLGWLAPTLDVPLTLDTLITHSMLDNVDRAYDPGPLIQPALILRAPVPEPTLPVWLKVERYPAGVPHWQITAVEYKPAGESDMTCNAYVRAWKDGQPALGAIAQLWSRPPLFDEWQADKVLERIHEPTGDKAGTDFFVPNGFDPGRGEVGPLAIQMKGPSDRLTGIGLPLNRHDGWLVVFEWVDGSVLPPPTPATDLGAILRGAAARETRIAVNDQAWLYKQAQKAGYGAPETAEFEFTYQGATWVGQEFALGFRAIKKGDIYSEQAFRK